MKVRARVSPRILQYAQRMFPGTVDGRVVEILQNSFRAGAKNVWIRNLDDEWVEIRDDGHGIKDFQSLLSLGDTDWPSDAQDDRNRAGVGFFSLAPRLTIIRSNGMILKIDPDGWTSKELDVKYDADPVRCGTIIRFRDKPWQQWLVSKYAEYGPIDVYVDDEKIERRQFLVHNGKHFPHLGCRIDILITDEDKASFAKGSRYYVEKGAVYVNFHGLVVESALPDIFHNTYSRPICLVEMTGEPTGLQMKLPDHSSLHQDSAAKELNDILEREIFEAYARLPEHSLPYRLYTRGRALGVDLREASPQYTVGTCDDRGGLELSDIDTPKNFKISDGTLLRLDDNAEILTLNLLAIYGQYENPEDRIIPVYVPADMMEYSWAKNLVRAVDVKIKCGDEINSETFLAASLFVVKSINVSVRLSDGRTVRASAPIAVKEDELDVTVFVTTAAKELVDFSDIWYVLGGPYLDSESDTYETQRINIETTLLEFWEQLYGPYETLRRRLFQELNYYIKHWKTAQMTPDGTLQLEFNDGNVEIVKDTP